MKVWILGTIVFSSQFLFAETGSTLSVPASQPAQELRQVIIQKKVEDTHVITDKKLQADEGSFSKYSMKFNLSYAGPGIGDLGNKNQPNPDGVVSNNQTKISGSIGARYRIDSVSAVSVGTGIAAIHPMHGWTRTDVNNPYLSYDKSSRYEDLQVRNILSVGGITIPEYRKVGETASASYEIDLVHNIGDSRLAAGLDSKFEYFHYDRGYIAKTDRKSAQYYLSFYPNLKYQFSDKLNVNTSWAVMFLNPRSLDNRYALWNRTITQRIGVGYSYKRDVYLSPFITVYPNNLKTTNTTFNIGATFSVL